jgi:hypothetical protein
VKRCTLGVSSLRCVCVCLCLSVSVSVSVCKETMVLYWYMCVSYIHVC